MKFALVATLAAIFAPQTVFASPGSAASVTYDYNYQNPSFPLSSTACSNGDNGLVTKGYPTLGSLPNFPNVGGIPGLVWNSPLCGTCWELVYTYPNGNTSTVVITAVDASYLFNLSPQAFGSLAGATGFAAGTVKATATQVPASSCGFK
ncbi:hypothetical protein ID866_5837 [Astraeus odoratus]|nr:hypothetical protein ID866_5837 [Astraeus odoratus]